MTPWVWTDEVRAPDKGFEVYPSPHLPFWSDIPPLARLSRFIYCINIFFIKIMATQSSLVLVERIEKAILLIRGHKVILDSNSAGLYLVPTKRLNEQVQ